MIAGPPLNLEPFQDNPTEVQEYYQQELQFYIFLGLLVFNYSESNLVYLRVRMVPGCMLGPKVAVTRRVRVGRAPNASIAQVVSR